MSAPTDPNANVFTSLPRQERIDVPTDQTAKRAVRPKAPRAPFRRVVVATILWGIAIARVIIRSTLLNFVGKRTHAAQARIMREELERLGPSGIKIGKQISTRIDMMPLTYTLELAAMPDVAEPIETRWAVRRIERSVGRPLAEIFQHFDPTPLASTTIECVYRAVLLTGEPVSVKVRRKGVRMQVMVDLTALSFFMRALELTTILREGFTEQLRTELLAMANHQLDYTVQSRYQTLLRVRSERDGLKWVTAAPLHQELCSHAIIVSDWVEGTPLTQVLAAVETNDKDALLGLAELGIDPQKVARRMLKMAWWSSLEGLFFNAEAMPRDILVQRGSRLVFLHFEDCGTLSSRDRRLYSTLLERLGVDDVSGAAQSLVRMLSPLPFIDVYEFTKRIEGELWQRFFALQDDQAQWWERTTIGVWLAAVHAARQDGVTIRLEVVRLMRSAIAFDSIALRLDPEINLLDEFKLYRKKADFREAKRAIQTLEGMSRQEINTKVASRAARLAEGFNRAMVWLELTVDNLPVTNLALSGKAAFVASEALRAFARFLALLVVTMTWVFGSSLALGVYISPYTTLLTALQHPAFAVSFFLLLLFSARRVLFRLNDKSPGR